MIVSHLIEVVLIITLGCLLRWENKKRDRIQSQMEGGLEGRDLDATAFLDMTDRENLKYVLSHRLLADLIENELLVLLSLVSFGSITNFYSSLQFPVHLLNPTTYKRCVFSPVSEDR